MAKQELKKGQQIPFTQVANNVLNDKSLSWKAKGLFAYLYSKPESWDFESIRISKDSSDGRDSTRAGIKELEEAGYLKRNKLGDRKMEYVIQYDPMTENQSLPVTENPTDGNSHSGKSRHISNIVNTSNTDSINNIRETTPGEEARQFFAYISKQSEVIEWLESKGMSWEAAQYEVNKFISYWTEPTKSGKRQLWETKPTFEVRRRLATWLGNKVKWESQKVQEKKGVSI